MRAPAGAPRLARGCHEAPARVLAAATTPVRPPVSKRTRHPLLLTGQRSHPCISPLLGRASCLTFTAPTALGVAPHERGPRGAYKTPFTRNVNRRARRTGARARAQGAGSVR